MNLLIDTHVFVWVTLTPKRLSRQARSAMADKDNVLWLSAACAYEIELKRERDLSLRRLPTDILVAAEGLGLKWLSITPAHALAAGRLPRVHGDPFDRLMIAQTIQEGMTFVTADGKVADYDLPVLW